MGPAALGLPTVIASGKGLEPSIRERGQFLRPPSVRTVRFPFTKPGDDLSDLSASDRGEGVIETRGPAFATLPQLVPRRSGIGQPRIKRLGRAVRSGRECGEIVDGA